MAKLLGSGLGNDVDRPDITSGAVTAAGPEGRALDGCSMWM